MTSCTSIEKIPVTDRESWLELRKADVTASTIAALFGCHPYVTALALYVEKCGVDLSQPDSAILRRGRLLEGAVAAAVAEQRPEWRIEKASDYFRDRDIKIGATPDFFIHGDPRGLGILQAKTVAPSVFAKSWTDDTPPFWVSLQAITEMMLTGATWGAVAALVVDPFDMRAPVYEVPRHQGVEERIVAAVRQFWEDVEAGREPGPDYGRDADLLAALYPAEEPAKVVDLNGSNHLPVLLAERAELKSRMKVDEQRCKEIETEIKFALADAEIGRLNDWRITFKTQQRKAFSVAASSTRVLRITDNRPSQGTSADADSF